MLAIRNLLRVSCALVLLCCSIFVHADSIKLVSATGGSSNGVDVYPYNFNINGSNSLTSLACLNYNREVTFGEQWQVTIHGLDMGSSQTAIDYRAEAVLFSEFGTNNLSNSDVQYAMWSIFDSAVTSNSAFTATSQQLVNMAMQSAVNPNLISSGFFTNFLLYTPTSDQTGWTSGMPQEFIGDPSVAATPEPSSIVLLGTSLLCSAAFLFRNRFAGAGSLA